MAELVFESEIDGRRFLITAKVVVSGGNLLPSEFQDTAINGIMKYFRAVQWGREIADPAQLERVLQDEHHGVRVLANNNPRKKTPSICWWPDTVTIRKI